MSKQFGMFDKRHLAAAVLLVCGFAAEAASRAGIEADMAVGPGIAAQGNESLRSIREDMRESLRDAQPLAVQPKPGVATAVPASQPVSLRQRVIEDPFATCCCGDAF